MGRVAEHHLKEMKEKGVKREDREKQRMNSSLQWEVVKGSLERLLVMNVYSPDNLEISLLSLQTVLVDNASVCRPHQWDQLFLPPGSWRIWVVTHCLHQEAHQPGLVRMQGH